MPGVTLKSLILTLVLIITFTACSNKQNIVKEELANESSFEESFEDEFASEDEDLKDVLESYNKAITSFNDGFYTHALSPISTTYSNIVHEDIRVGISNVFRNLLFPIRVVNNLLQVKFLNAFEETERFLINSTIGFLGIFDIAKTSFDIEAHNEDFGQTLGFYGIQAGPHIVLPFFGPSNLRDSLSFFADSYLSPISSSSAINYKIPNDLVQSFAYTSVDTINNTSLTLGQYELLKEDSIDLYILLKNYYEEKRKREIRE